MDFGTKHAKVETLGDLERTVTVTGRSRNRGWGSEHE
jgi:hypothetical protein